MVLDMFTGIDEAPAGSSTEKVSIDNIRWIALTFSSSVFFAFG